MDAAGLALLHMRSSSPHFVALSAFSSSSSTFDVLVLDYDDDDNSVGKEAHTAKPCLKIYRQEFHATTIVINLTSFAEKRDRDCDS
jgi:hypothetical protein